MPTRSRDGALSREEALQRIRRSAEAREGTADPGPGHVGLEPERLPIVIDSERRPLRRLPLHGPGGVLEILDGVAAATPLFLARDPGRTPPVFPLPQGGSLTFEPGAQVEHSTAVHPTAAAALDDVERVAEALDRAFCPRGIALASCGLDLWHSVDDVPQQLAAPRYRAMDAYFAERGGEGRVMMRHSGSLQVNLDLGPPGVDRERWLVSQVASPVLAAIFATSPGTFEGRPVASRRAIAWQELDPTRTGFPRPLVDGSSDDPGEQYAAFALEADVMFARRPDPEDPAALWPGRPGWTFGSWVDEGHPELGWPTLEDLEVHLTTLFPEVRARGFLELRAMDDLPARWRAALVTLVCGLVLDDAARGEALALLGGLRGELPALWRRAAREGVGDERLGVLAREAWTIGLAGAERLPAGYLRPEHLANAREYLERFTALGRSPSDELRELGAEDPALSLEWCIECGREPDSLTTPGGCG